MRGSEQERHNSQRLCFLLVGLSIRGERCHEIDVHCNGRILELAERIQWYPILIITFTYSISPLDRHYLFPQTSYDQGELYQCTFYSENQVQRLNASYTQPKKANKHSMYCSAQISKHIFYFGRHPVHPDNLPTRQDHLTLTSAHKPYKVPTQTNC